MRKTLLLAVATGFSLFATTAFAQLNGGGMGGGGFGGGGMSGGSSRGGSSMGGAGGSSGMFGSRQLGGNLSGGQRSLAGGSRGGQTGMQGSDQVGQITGNERFLRGNRQGQFVGGDAGQAQAFIGALQGGQGGRGGMNNLFGGGGGFGGGGFGGQRNNRNINNDQRGQQASREERYRPTFKIAFDPPVAGPNRMSETLTARLQKSQRLQFVSPAQVMMSGRTAILTGEVATEHDRNLAEQLVLLEGGVSAVQNELRVRQAAESPAAAGSVSLGSAAE